MREVKDEMAIETFEDVRHLTVTIGAIITMMIGLWLVMKVNFFMEKESKNEKMVVMIGGSIFVFNGLGSMLYATLYYSDQVYLMISVTEDLWTLAHMSILAFAVYYTLYFEGTSEKGVKGHHKAPPPRSFLVLFIIISTMLYVPLLVRREVFRQYVYFDFYHMVIGVMALLFLYKWYTVRKEPQVRLRCSLIFFAFVLHQVTLVKIPDFFVFDVRLYGSENWMWSWHLVYFITFIIMVFSIFWTPWRGGAEARRAVKFERAIGLIILLIYFAVMITPEDVYGYMYEIIWVFFRPILFLFGILFMNVLNLNIPRMIVNLFIALLFIEIALNIIDEVFLAEGMFVNMLFTAVVGTSRFIVRGTRRLMVRVGRYLLKMFKEATLDMSGDKLGRGLIGVASQDPFRVEVLKALVLATINVLSLSLFQSLNMDFTPYLAAAMAFSFLPVLDQIHDVVKGSSHTKGKPTKVKAQGS